MVLLSRVDSDQKAVSVPYPGILGKNLDTNLIGHIRVLKSSFFQGPRSKNVFGPVHATPFFF